MEREMERCRNAKISVELERVLNKNAFYWERDNAFHWERDNAFHWELMVRPETVMLQHVNKILWSSTEESSSFFFICSSITSNCRMASFGFRPLCNHGTLRANYLFNWDLKLKNTNQCLGCLRTEDGVLSHQTFLVKNFSFLLPPRKQDDRCFDYWLQIKAAVLS